LDPNWVILIQLLISHPLSLRSILILSSHLSLGLLNGRYPTKTLYEFLFSPCLLHVLPISSKTNKQTQWPESASKLHRQPLVCEVSANYCGQRGGECILRFLDRSSYFLFQVAP
jgi:hypothetical protein